jgi:glycosyltransferase involved in cell wall biosynthesis
LPNIIFFMEQHLGHRAYYLNLRQAVDREPRVNTNWVEVTYTKPDRFWDRIPRIPANLRGTISGRQQVIEGLHQYPADLLFFNTQVPAVIVGPPLYQHPFILSTDITPIQYDQMADLYHHQPDKNTILKSLKHRANRTAFQKAAFLFPWSTWTAQSIIDDYGVSPHKIEVIPPGIDLDFWKPPLEKKTNPVPTILFVGGDLERKGGLDLLAAFRRLPVGSAELVLVTRSEVPETPGVRVIQHLVPNSPELIDLYHRSDIFVLPSKAEAFGIAAVEASAAGLPVIAAPVGGLIDIVDHERTGLFIQPGNQEELFSAIARLIDHPELRQSFGNAARQKAECNFDAQKCAKRIIEKILIINNSASH